jgi:hypothetical protein
VLEKRIMVAATGREEIADTTDEEIDAIVAEFGGDHRAAIRALLHDLTTVIMDSKAAVSRGYVRGNLFDCASGNQKVTI